MSPRHRFNFAAVSWHLLPLHLVRLIILLDKEIGRGTGCNALTSPFGVYS